jgi:hypothetical protein
VRDWDHFLYVDDRGVVQKGRRFADSGSVGEGAEDGEEGQDESELREKDPLAFEGSLGRFFFP